MSDLDPLKLVALASKIDEPLIPPLEQVVIFSRMLGYICKLKLQNLPDQPFKLLPCPSPDPENLDEGIESKGIDFLGRYEFKWNEITVTLFICRIIKFCARHGFNREDITKIVLIHELAHYVTLLGTNSEVRWGETLEEDCDKKEDVAQEATHLLLRVAGYGHLVQVFDALSQLCPAKYDTWRKKWEGQLRKKDTLDVILKDFRDQISKLPRIDEREDMVSGGKCYEC